MTEIAVVRRGGVLMAATDEDREAMRRIPAGEAVRFEFRAFRNNAFHRKWFALARFAFDHWQNDAAVIEYRGHPVRRSFDQFRRDLTVLAGFYTPVYGVDGSVRLEPKSLAWHRMDEDEFSKLYDATVDVVIQHVAGLDMPRDELIALVEEAAAFG